MSVHPPLISYAVPVHKRLEDLEQALPRIVAAANASPPVQIVIVDYGDQPPIHPLIESTYYQELQRHSHFTIVTYRGRPHYHMAHARNLSIRASIGAYVVISCADVLPRENFFQTIRQRLQETQADVLRSQTSGYVGVVTVKRQQIMDAGGFDERFEFYGREDKDLLLRLGRRGVKQSTYDLDSMMDIIPTNWEQKLSNYRLSLTRKEAHDKATAIYDENIRNNVMVANEGQSWGEL
jgi:hypothetical protein